MLEELVSESNPALNRASSLRTGPHQASVLTALTLGTLYGALCRSTVGTAEGEGERSPAEGGVGRQSRESRPPGGAPCLTTLCFLQTDKEQLTAEARELRQKVRYLQDQLSPLTRQRDYQEKEIQRLNKVGPLALVPGATGLPELSCSTYFLHRCPSWLSAQEG